MRCLSPLESKDWLRGKKRGKEPVDLFPFTRSLYSQGDLSSCVPVFSFLLHQLVPLRHFSLFYVCVTVGFQSSTQEPTSVTSVPDSRILYSAFPMLALTHLVASAYPRRAALSGSEQRLINVETTLSCGLLDHLLPSPDVTYGWPLACYKSWCKKVTFCTDLRQLRSIQPGT